MKYLRLILVSLLLCASAKAADQQLYIIVTVTNAFGTTNIINSITVNGSLRKHTNNITSSPSTLIQSTNVQTIAMTNMYRHFANNPPPGIGIDSIPYSTNAFIIRARINDTLTFATAGDWGTIILKTNPVQGAVTVRVPWTSYDPTNQTNYASMLVAGLNLSTTALAQASIVLSNAVQLTLAQTVSSKDFIDGSVTNVNIRSMWMAGSNHLDFFFSPNVTPALTGGGIRFGSTSTNTLAILVPTDNDPAQIGYYYVTNSNPGGGGKFVDVSGFTPFSSGYLLNAGSAVKMFPVVDSSIWPPGSQLTNTWKTINVWTNSSNQFQALVTMTAGANMIGGWWTNFNGAANGLTVTNLQGLGGVLSNLFLTRVAISNATSINGTLGTITNGTAVGLLAQTFTATNSTLQGTLDIQGDTAFPMFTITTLANSNNVMAPGTNRFIAVSGPTTAFAVASITGGRTGRELWLLNRSGQNMTMAHENGFDPTPGNRITMSPASDAVYGDGQIVHLLYDGTSSRWRAAVPTATATNSMTTNAANFTINTNDFLLNTYYTNAPQRAYASATVILTATVTANAKVALYLDQDGDGVWEQTGISAQTGLGLATADWFQLGAFLQPSARFMFTNLSTGAATASINGSSSQWVKQ